MAFYPAIRTGLLHVTTNYRCHRAITVTLLHVMQVVLTNFCKNIVLVYVWYSIGLHVGDGVNRCVRSISGVSFRSMSYRAFLKRLTKRFA
jgi:hypothetical protein